LDNQDHHAAKPMKVVPDDALSNGDFLGVIGSTPLNDLSDPADEGYTIYVRDGFPDLS